MLATTSDLLEVARRAGLGLTLSAAEMYATLQQLQAAAVAVDLHAAVRLRELWAQITRRRAW